MIMIVYYSNLYPREYGINLFNQKDRPENAEIGKIGILGNL